MRHRENIDMDFMSGVIVSKVPRGMGGLSGLTVEDLPGLNSQTWSGESLINPCLGVFMPGMRIVVLTCVQNHGKSGRGRWGP